MLIDQLLPEEQPLVDKLVPESSDTPVLDQLSTALEMNDSASLVDSLIPKTKEPSLLEQIEYGFESDPRNFYNNLQMWIDSNAPGVLMEISDKVISAIKPEEGSLLNQTSLGYLRKPLAEQYGEDFYDLSPEERRNRILATKAAELQQQYPDVHGTEYAESGATAVGEIAAAVKDPLTYLPFGQIKGAQTAGQFFKNVGPTAAAVTAGTETMYQAARESEFDLIQIGAHGLAGFLLTPLIAFGGSKVAGAITKKIGQKVQQKLDEKASEVIEAVQEKSIQKLAEGKPRMQALQEVLDELSLDVSSLNAAMRHTNTNTNGLFIPQNQQVAQEIVNNATPIGMRPWKSGSFVDDLIEPISSRIKKINDGIWYRLMRLEMNVHMRPYKLTQEANQLFKAAKGLSKENKQLFERAWLSRDLNTLNRLFHNNEKALNNIKSIRSTLDNLHAEYKKHVNKDLPYLTDYLPRIVRDIKGLRSALGYEKKAALDKALYSAELKKGKALTELEKLDIIGKYMRGYPREPVRSGLTKSRQFTDDIPEEALPFYATAEESFHAYVRRAVYDIEKAKFFGKNLKFNKELNSIDIDKSISSYILSDPKLIKDSDKIEELRKLLTTRFGVGELAPKSIVSLLRNVGYASLLGNPVSAATQLQDIAFTAARTGIIPVIKAITGKTNIKAVELGLKKASEELAESSAWSARALDKILKIVQFERVDQLGKTINLNANLIKYRKLAQTDKGIAKIKDEYASAYGEDFAMLVDDLKKNRMTENVKILLWSELSEIQPISKSEMPLKYLENPNGRLFYMLQSFTLKQLDYVRRNIYNQIKAGNVVEGVSNLTKYMTYLSVAGMGVGYLKMWMLGKEINQEELPDDFYVALWKNFAASELTIRRILEAESITDKGKAAISSGFEIGIPILDIVNTVAQDVFKYFDSPDEYGLSLEDKPKTYRSLQYVPGVGRFLYNFFGGGLEKWHEQQERRRNKKYDL